MRLCLIASVLFWFAAHSQANDSTAAPVRASVVITQTEAGTPAVRTPTRPPSTASTPPDSPVPNKPARRPTATEFSVQESRVTTPQHAKPGRSSQRSTTSNASTTERYLHQQTAEFSRLQRICSYPGEMLTIQGKNLLSLPPQYPALNIEGRIQFLPVLNQTNDFLMVQLPQQGLEPDSRYPLVLAEPSTPQLFDPTGITVQLCATGKPNRTSHQNPTTEVLVFTTLKEKTRTHALLQKKQLNIIETYDLTGLDAVMFRLHTNNAPALIKELRTLLPHADIDSNSHLTASSKPRLYAKKAIQWPQKHCQGNKKTSTPPIGLIDGEIDRTHRAFNAQHITMESFIDNQTADTEHATAIASILIGNAPKQGFDGLLPGTRIYNAIVLRSSTDGTQLASVQSVLRGLNWLIIKKVRLVNLSLTTDHANFVLIRAIEKSLERGTLIFAAAGNNGSDAPPIYPAAIEGVFGITAVDVLRRHYNAANQGEYVDFSAPGVDIWTAFPGHQGQYQSGTSFAAPYALALASQYLINNQSLSKDLMTALLKKDAQDLGTPLKDPQYGWGLINAASLGCTISE